MFPVNYVIEAADSAIPTSLYKFSRVMCELVDSIDETQLSTIHY